MRNYRNSSALRKLQNLCERANSVNEGWVSKTNVIFSPEEMTVVFKHLTDAKKACDDFKKKNKDLSFDNGELAVVFECDSVLSAVTRSVFGKKLEDGNYKAKVSAHYTKDWDSEDILLYAKEFTLQMGSN